MSEAFGYLASAMSAKEQDGMPKGITKTEAENYLQICKESYADRVRKGEGIMTTLRSEIMYWQKYLNLNFPEPEKGEQCQQNPIPNPQRRPSRSL
jgi:hypothetical protein